MRRLTAFQPLDRSPFGYKVGCVTSFVDKDLATNGCMTIYQIPRYVTQCIESAQYENFLKYHEFKDFLARVKTANSQSDVDNIKKEFIDLGGGIFDMSNLLQGETLK
jgi:hypothetical protein